MFRSLMFIPGNRINMLEKSLTISPDVYIPDMEDSVPINRKDEARNIIEGFLPNMTIKNNIVIPRVNSLNSGFFEEDVRANYENSKLFAEKAEYFNTRGFLIISKNVRLEDTRGNMFADKLIFDIKDKQLKIQSDKNNLINANVKLKWKRTLES